MIPPFFYGYTGKNSINYGYSKYTKKLCILSQFSYPSGYYPLVKFPALSIESYHEF